MPISVDAVVYIQGPVSRNIRARFAPLCLRTDATILGLQSTYAKRKAIIRDDINGIVKYQKAAACEMRHYWPRMMRVSKDGVWNPLQKMYRM